MKNMRKKSVAVLAGLAITGLVGAAAASLGGLNAESLGSDDEVVAACDTVGGIDVGFTTSYDAASGRYEVDSVDFAGADAACEGLEYDATLTGAGGALLGSNNGTVPTGGAWSVSLTDVSAEAVLGVSLVISG